MSLCPNFKLMLMELLLRRLCNGSSRLVIDKKGGWEKSLFIPVTSPKWLQQSTQQKSTHVIWKYCETGHVNTRIGFELRMQSAETNTTSPTIPPIHVLGLLYLLSIHLLRLPSQGGLIESSPQAPPAMRSYQKQPSSPFPVEFPSMTDGNCGSYQTTSSMFYCLFLISWLNLTKVFRDTFLRLPSHPTTS